MHQKQHSCKILTEVQIVTEYLYSYFNVLELAY